VSVFELVLPPRARPEPGLRRLAIVPALNEAACVGAVIDEIRAADPDFEVIVVDDGSTDATVEVARRHGAHVVRLPFNLGIGGAVQTGFRYAWEQGFDVAVQVDADGQHDPRELRAILAPVAAGEADLVIGSRFAGAGAYRASHARRAGSRVFAGLLSVLTGRHLTDTTSSFRAVGRRGIRLFAADYPHGFLETVEATVMAARHGLRVVEVPVSMRARSTGRSSLTAGISVFYSFKVLLAIFVGYFRPTLPLPEDA
jgi:glycosyltransferase involved in cell wall biosynthesis